MYEVIGIRCGTVKKEGRTKGKGYSVLYLAFESRGVQGKEVREVFVFDDLIESARPLMPGDHLDFSIGLDGRIKSVHLL